MTLATLGDLARGFMQRSASARLNRELATLSGELTTGLKQDVTSAMKGHTAPLAGIERALARLDSNTFAVREAGIFADTTGIALGAVSNRLGSIDVGALSVSDGVTSVQVDALAASARNAFTGIISDMNTLAGGRPLFGGTLGGGRTTRPAEDILADVVASVSGATTANDIATGIDAYFADGGPFQTNDYLGTSTDLAPFDLGDGSQVSPAVRADDPALREALATVARVAVLDEGLPLTHEVRTSVISASAPSLLSASQGVIGLEAKAGSAAGSIDAATLRIETERDGLRTARLDLLSADPFEAASRLQQTELQLQSLHTLTARLSQLNLTSYLR